MACGVTDDNLLYMVVEGARYAADLVAARLSTANVAEDARLVSGPTGACADEGDSVVSDSCT